MRMGITVINLRHQNVSLKFLSTKSHAFVFRMHVMHVDDCKPVFFVLSVSYL
jgi:hypothetical protein